MNDNDIIKALECCINREGCSDRCPYHKNKYEVHCMEQHGHDLLGLINRLKEENERLKAENAEQDRAIINALHHMKVVRTEAYKEFSERFKKELTTGSGVMRRSVLDVINDTLKEMTEDNDA